MKIIALLAASAFGFTGLVTAVPADAQRHGWNDGYRDGPRFHNGYRGHRGGYHAPRRGFNAGRGYARPRVVCRIQRGYYGRERVCVRRFR